MESVKQSGVRVGIGIFVLNENCDKILIGKRSKEQFWDYQEGN